MVTRAQFLEAYRAMGDVANYSPAEVINRLCYELFDSPEAKAREIDVTKMEPIKINFVEPKPAAPPLSIDAQMRAIAHGGRCFGGHFDANGDVSYFLSNLTYRDKLVVQDLLVQNINLHFRKVNELDP